MGAGDLELWKRNLFYSLF